MANTDAAHGLRPCMRNDGGGNPTVNPYTKAAAYGQAIYRWDPVTLLAGVLNGPASGITAGTTRYRGVSLNASIASTLATHLVMDAKEAVYEAQEDGTGAANAVAAKMGYNANLTTTAGDATLLSSKVQISGTSINTTSSLDVRVLRLWLSADNAYGANGRFELKFNKFLDNPEVTVT